MHNILEERFGYYGYDVFRTRFCIKSYQMLLPLWVERLGTRLPATCYLCIYLSGPVGVYQGLSVSVGGGDRGQGAAGAGGTTPHHTAHHGHHSHPSHATLS